MYKFELLLIILQCLCSRVASVGCSMSRCMCVFWFAMPRCQSARGCCATYVHRAFTTAASAAAAGRDDAEFIHRSIVDLLHLLPFHESSRVVRLD